MVVFFKMNFGVPTENFTGIPAFRLKQQIKYVVEKGVMCVTKPKIFMMLLYLLYYIIINCRNSMLATDIVDRASISFGL